MIFILPINEGTIYIAVSHQTTSDMLMGAMSKKLKVKFKRDCGRYFHKWIWILSSSNMAFVLYFKRTLT